MNATSGSAWVRSTQLDLVLAVAWAQLATTKDQTSRMPMHSFATDLPPLAAPTATATPQLAVQVSAIRHVVHRCSGLTSAALVGTCLLAQLAPSQAAGMRKAKRVHRDFAKEARALMLRRAAKAVAMPGDEILS